MIGRGQAGSAITEAALVRQGKAPGVAAGANQVTGLAVKDRAVIRNLGDEATGPGVYVAGG